MEITSLSPYVYREVYVTIRCPSVPLSVCPIYRPLQQRAAGCCVVPAARNIYQRHSSTAHIVARRSAAVAAISFEWWGSGGGAPSGVQGQSPWSGGQRGIAP